VPHSRSGRGGEEKNPIIASAGNWTPVVQPVAYSLYWLSYPFTNMCCRNWFCWQCFSGKFISTCISHFNEPRDKTRLALSSKMLKFSKSDITLTRLCWGLFKAMLRSNRIYLNSCTKGELANYELTLWFVCMRLDGILGENVVPQVGAEVWIDINDRQLYHGLTKILLILFARLPFP
jgi:hypothetical protein